jgi:hypothetical protein
MTEIAVLQTQFALKTRIAAAKTFITGEDFLSSLWAELETLYDGIFDELQQPDPATPAATQQPTQTE